MTSTSPDAPPWPYCRYGATANDVGCRGLIVEPHAACLAHLGDVERSAYLAGLRPGADVDHRGTPLWEELHYGETEMRRHAHDIPRSERALLTTYWALSGYGLRASRALGWLLGGMATTVLLMMLWGLPKDDPKPQSSSVAFRSSGQNLTTAGNYTEMASRLVEPALLGLAVLAVRGRVKR
ncbi:hypothetical protein ACFWFH_17710 [Streptomyces coelicoflavus]|uniref:hypothetical protein n=1 Tax=Streptomyces coelicoflavus TaxID=285562 RepID=UPI00365304BB